MKSWTEPRQLFTRLRKVLTPTMIKTIMSLLAIGKTRSPRLFCLKKRRIPTPSSRARASIKWLKRAKITIPTLRLRPGCSWRTKNGKVKPRFHAK